MALEHQHLMTMMMTMMIMIIKVMIMVRVMVDDCQPHAATNGEMNIDTER